MSSTIYDRRGLLAPELFSGKGDAHIVEISREIMLEKAIPAPVTLHIRYIPDTSTVKPETLRKYLAAVEKEPLESIEAAADMVAEDLHNELIPFFLEVEMSATYDGTSMRVFRQATQPDWSNPALISRLKPF